MKSITGWNSSWQYGWRRSLTRLICLYACWSPGECQFCTYSVDQTVALAWSLSSTISNFCEATSSRHCRKIEMLGCFLLVRHQRYSDCYIDSFSTFQGRTWVLVVDSVAKRTWPFFIRLIRRHNIVSTVPALVACPAKLSRLPRIR